MADSASSSGERKATTIINQQTLIPIGVACAVVTTCVITGISVFNWMNKRFEELNDRSQGIKEQSAAMVQRLERLEEKFLNRWSTQDMEVWVLRFEKHNPALTVPDPRTIGKSGKP